MRLVIIESPYAGDRKRNIEYAKECMLDSLNRGEAPLASHLLYTQILDDDIPEHRNLGIVAGFAWAEKADAVIVYGDLGISRGMMLGIKRAKLMGQHIEYRKIR